MSITFHPAINLHKSIHRDDPVWSAQWVQHKSWDELPNKFKLPQYRDLDYVFFEQGAKPLTFWENFAKTHGLQLFNNYPFKKIWVDNIKNYSVALIATGEQKEHMGIELNISNMNADALTLLLNIPESGSMNPIALLKRIEHVKNNDVITEFTRDHNEWQTQLNDPTNPNDFIPGAKHISFGLDREKILRYLMRLEEICDHCIRFECNVSWG